MRRIGRDLRILLYQFLRIGFFPFVICSMRGGRNILHKCYKSIKLNNLKSELTEITKTKKYIERITNTASSGEFLSTDIMIVAEFQIPIQCRRLKQNWHAVRAPLWRRAEFPTV